MRNAYSSLGGQQELGPTAPQLIKIHPTRVSKDMRKKRRKSRHQEKAIDGKTFTEGLTIHLRMPDITKR